MSNRVAAIIGGVAILLLIGRVVTFDASAGFVARCVYPTDANKPTDVVKACTALINSNSLSNQELARAYWTRCAAYRDLGEAQKAKDDCDAARRLDPSVGGR